MTGLAFSFVKHIKYYVKYIILSFCILSSSLAMLNLGQGLYLIALFIIGAFSLKNNDNLNNKKGLYISFLFCCYLSCFVNNIWDLRLFLFTLVLIAFTPILNSFKIFLFRRELIYTFLLFFPILSIASLYCYFAGINLGGVSADGTYHDFSAFFSISISLAAAVGISNVVITWIILTSKNKLYKLIFLVILLSSIFISIVSASRSALAASMLSIIVLVYFSSKKLKYFFVYSLLILGLTIIIYPFYSKYTDRIEQKFEAGKGKQYGSRTLIWVSSYNHFKSTPVFGYGFAVNYNGDIKTVGRGESGSGWLSILFQTGILGSIPIIILMFKTLKVAKFIKCDKKLLLFYSVFIYLCLHSFFEGYILTSMLYMCLLFWLLLGYLHSYPMFIEQLKNYKDNLN